MTGFGGFNQTRLDPGSQSDRPVRFLKLWLYPLVALISKFKHQGSCCCCMAQQDWDHKLQGNLREILFLSMLVSLTKIETLFSLSLSLSLVKTRLFYDPRFCHVSTLVNLKGGLTKVSIDKCVKFMK